LPNNYTRKVKKYKESHAIKCIDKFIQVGNERISSLKKVRLNNCELEKPGAKKISQLLQSKIQVEVLEIAENSFGNEGIHEIEKGIDAGMPPLLELDLSSNHIDEKGANKLIKALNSCNILEKLLLNDNQLNPEGAISLIENLLPYLPNLKNLGLAKNFMKDEGCHVLCDYLSVPQCPL
jgi:Ran GTPase-activating protein (RanGAP) involved in mRNA processing and transport